MTNKKTVLFIAYYFEPYIGVGAQRVSYWAKNISRVNPNIVCDVVTATPQNGIKTKSIRNIYYVEDSGYSKLKGLIKDPGVTWLNDLKRFFMQNRDNLNYDYVLLTGGPFMHFAIAKLLKKLFRCKIILDFRDPFANNPRFNNNLVKSKVKGFFEKPFIKAADILITVNKYVGNLLMINNSSELYIVENGFDETIVNRYIDKKVALEGTRINLVYAGSFYEDRNPRVFLDVVSKELENYYCFNHIGKRDSFLTPYRTIINEYGVKSYQETIEIISSCDIGLIFTSGKEFESTTKVFDYIGLKKAIFIITEGTSLTGSLSEILKDYPKVFWCNNNYWDIHQMLKKILENDLSVNKYDNYCFTRGSGLNKLVSILEMMENGGI